MGAFDGVLDRPGDAGPERFGRSYIIRLEGVLPAVFEKILDDLGVVGPLRRCWSGSGGLGFGLRGFHGYGQVLALGAGCALRDQRVLGVLAGSDVNRSAGLYGADFGIDGHAVGILGLPDQLGALAGPDLVGAVEAADGWRLGDYRGRGSGDIHGKALRRRLSSGAFGNQGVLRGCTRTDGLRSLVSGDRLTVERNLRGVWRFPFQDG